MKTINFQIIQDVDDAIYPWIARNLDGTLIGFRNAPVRDYDNKVWMDPTDKSYGEIIPYPTWDTSVREPKDFVDRKEMYIKRDRKKREKAYNNAKMFSKSKGEDNAD
jgi:hypothetical protein